MKWIGQQSIQAHLNILIPFSWQLTSWQQPNRIVSGKLDSRDKSIYNYFKLCPLGGKSAIWWPLFKGGEVSAKGKVPTYYANIRDVSECNI